MRQRKIKVRKYSDTNRPHLKFVVNYREAGKRKRSFFETKEQAASFAAFKNAERQRNGIEHADFPTAIRVMAQNAVEQLKPFGKTITDAVEHYVAYLKANEKSCTATQLVKELLKAKEADGAASGICGTFAAGSESSPKSSTARWSPLSPARRLTTGCARFGSRRSHAIITARLVLLAFNFAMRAGYATSNPAMDAAKAKVTVKRPASSP